jgi:hypothetical protein
MRRRAKPVMRGVCPLVTHPAEETCHTKAQPSRSRHEAQPSRLGRGLGVDLAIGVV